jgi:hypothetical protein
MTHHRLVLLSSCVAMGLLSACAHPIAVPAPNQYGSASSMQNTPLHDRVPLVGYDGSLLVGAPIDPAAVPVFTPADQVDRATTFVTAQITPLIISQNGRNYTEAARTTDLVVAYGRLGEAGTTATIGDFQFGFEAYPGATNVTAGNMTHPDRLVNYVLYRQGPDGNPAHLGANQVRGDLILPGMTKGAKVGEETLLRTNDDYYKLKITAVALPVIPFTNKTQDNSLTPFPDEDGTQPLYTAQAQAAQN